MDPRKVQSIVEWATPTSCCEVLRSTAWLAFYYRSQGRLGQPPYACRVFHHQRCLNPQCLPDPLLIDRGAHPLLPLSPPRDDCTRAAGESPAHYARQMQQMEATVRELFSAAQAERKTKLDAGQVDTVFQVPGW